MPDVTPGPSKVSITIPSANTIASFTAAILSLLVALHVMQQPTADTINKKINDNKETIQTVVDGLNQIKNKPAEAVIVTPPAPVNPTPVPVDNSEQIKTLQDQIKNLSDIINKMNQPKPPDQVNPPPAPENLPQPSTLKVIITDENEKVVTTNTVNVGEQFLVTCSNPNVRWQVSKHGKVKKTELPNHLGYTFELADENAWIEFFVTASLDNQVSVMVTANKAPQPPPSPNVVPVPPTPVTPVKDRKLFVAVVEDAQNRTQATASVMSAMSLWNGLRDKGHDWRFYDKATTETKGKQAVTAAGAMDPALVIRDLTTGELLSVVPLPKTAKDVSAELAKWGTL